MSHFFPVSKQKLRVSAMRGFALPTILIASVVMLIVLVVSVSSTSTVRTALKAQYYEQLAQVAGEAGIAYAEACLNANGGVPQWTDAAPLKPNTNCSGVELVACPTTSTDPLCSVTLNDNVRSSFSIGLPKVEDPAVLVVAGGGGGAAAGSGGGAGGMVYTPSFGFSVGSYSINVGASGVGGVWATGSGGSKGGNSSIVSVASGATLISAEGGGGGVTHGQLNGNSGGSGGGGAITTAAPAGVAGSGVAGQGNAGGPGFVEAGWAGSLGGGGGAGGVGATASGAAGGGNGGAALANSITGSLVSYAGGGGAGEINGSFVGSGGGGGAGGGVVNSAGTSATANTGSGGGGGSYNGSYFNGGNGGSGVIIVSYPTGSLTATGGTITTSGTKTIHRFTSSNTFTVSAVNTLKTLPNTGYVEILRESNSAVWRRYDQKAAPSSVVPDLCSGNAKAIYGWNNASVVSSTYSIAGQSVKAIQSAVGSLNPGPNYFRKDFSVTSSGTYTLAVNGGATFDAYIDGRLLLYQVGGSTSTKTIDLSPGCHTIYIRAVNGAILPNSFELLASLTKSGETTPIVQSDSTWRVSSGPTVHYSDYRYSQSSGWSVARDLEAATTTNASWTATSGSSTTRSISTTHSASGTNYPPSQYTYFRDAAPIIVTSPVNVKITYTCDDVCNIYLDGQVVAFGTWPNLHTYNTTLSEGYHWLAASLYNGGTAVGASKIAIAVVNASTNSLITQTTASWDAADFWSPNFYEHNSYDATFVSNPPSYDCTCSTPGTTNLASNPSLGTSIGSWYISFPSGSTGTDSRQTSGGPPGVANAFFRRTLNATWSGGISASMDGAGVLSTPVIPGQKYTVSGYLRSNFANSGIRANIIESDIAGNQISNQLGTTVSTSVNTWQRVSSTFMLDAKTAFIQVRLQFVGVTGAPSGTTYDYTGMMITPGETVFNYADGSSSGWTWLGTANASPSSGPAL